MAEIKEENALLLQVDIRAAEESQLPWNMLEYNQVQGLLPFQYYYRDDKVCFRYPTEKLQSVAEYFQKKKGGFETLFFLCSEIIRIVEQGEEYLLKSEEYLLAPERIYWNRWEKKVSMCYLPGYHGNLQEGYTAFVEYLLQYTEHGDEQAVKFIYGLYDNLTSNGFSLEGLGEYFAGYRKVPERQVDILSSRKKEPEEKYYLVYCGGLWENAAFWQEELGAYPIPEQEEVQVGRDRAGDIVIPCPEISRRQVLLYWKDRQLLLMDAESTNGTYLNEKKVSSEEKQPCREGDYIRFGHCSFQLVCRRINKM